MAFTVGISPSDGLGIPGANSRHLFLPPTRSSGTRPPQSDLQSNLNPRARPQCGVCLSNSATWSLQDAAYASR